jgi:hypothetical protein
VTVEGLRFPFYLGAWLLGGLIVLIEFSSGLATTFIPRNPPGLGIPYLALIDVILLFTLTLIGVSVLVPETVVGRVQGCLTTLVSLGVILVGIALIMLAVIQLFVMIGLLASFFGAPVYFAIWGHFPSGVAASILGLLLLLKVGVAVLLLVAHQRFVQNKGLVLLIVTSLIANVIVSILQALPPGALVSVTDAIAAIVVGIIAVIWAIFLLITSIISIIKILRAPKAPPVGELTR